MIWDGGHDSTMEKESAASSRPFSSRSDDSMGHFRRLLSGLSDDLTRDNVDSLKFMAGLPEGCKENVKSGKDFFSELIRQDKISPTQLDFLIDLLKVIRRKDLVVKVEDFKKEQQRRPLGTPVVETTPGQLRTPKKGPVTNTVLMTPGESKEPHFSVQAQSETQDDVLTRQIHDKFYINDHIDNMPEYPSSRRPRGIALIISNETFEGGNTAKLRNRTGTANDEKNLQNLWEKLHFEVTIKKNLTAQEIYKTLREMSAKNHSDYDCFVCCLLSHGANGGIYGTDGELLEIREITSQFRGTACPSLSEKPKLFFIQACRGQEKDSGVQMESDAVTTDAMKHSAEPNESHFLLGYATPPGYVSWRSETYGSWYISKLCEVFDKYCESCDVMSMMVKVNDEVSEAFAKGGYKQCPAPVVTLRKKIYFKNN